MAKNKGLQRQRAQDRRKKKQAKRRKSLARRWPGNTVAGRVEHAASWPLRECLISTDRERLLYTPIILARNRPGGGIAASVFSVDIGCLGIKSAFTHPVLTPPAYATIVERLRETTPLVACDAAMGLKIIETARTYAANLGFAPDPDFWTAVRLFGDVDPKSCDLEVTCGRDGKPFYVCNPGEDPTDILATLTDKLGPDGFHYVIGGPAGLGS